MDQEEFGNFLLYIHIVYEYAFNGHVGAPIHEKLQSGAKALEIGCDAGVWITEVAAEYPNTEFYAVDFNISASNTSDENITFVKCNIFQKLPFPNDKFDYVFSRDKFLFFEKDNFYDYLSELLRILKPGGWLEVGYLLKHYIKNGPVTKMMTDAWQSWLKSQNIVKDFMENFERYLQETGKVESISHQLVKVPIGGSYAFGEFTCEICICYLKNANYYLALFMNISFEEYDRLACISESEMRAKD
ncbi:31536_t:CDS:2, partial [Gigaspora margarita]